MTIKNHTKFYKSSSPAFNEGEIWVDSCGNQVTVINTEQWGDGKYEHEVFYVDKNKQRFHKDVWSFQVRYVHLADWLVLNK